MSGADLVRIEAAFGLRLPAVYRTGVSPFPVAHEAGNAGSPVWDDADALIALNRRLRAEEPAWPEWLFAIGQSEGDPSGWAIDTRPAEAPVWWLEQMRLGPDSGPGAEAFADWFRDVAADLSEIPTSPRKVWWVFLVWLGLSVLGVVLFRVWARR
jgi:hypothetical protein